MNAGQLIVGALGNSRFEPGWTEGAPMRDYLLDPAVSASMLWRLHDETPAHLYHQLLNATGDRTDAKDLGTMVHTLTFEPEKFESAYVIVGQCEASKRDGERCTNAGTFWRDGQSFCGVKSHDPLGGAPMPDDLFVVGDGLRNQAIAMRVALSQHKRAQEILLAPGPREVVGVWQDERTGLWCRIRPDQLIHEPAEIDPELHWSNSNLKSTGKSASPFRFPRDFERMGHYFKAAFYRMGLEELGFPVQNFLYPVVEQGAPHEVIVYRLNEDALDIGEAEVRQALDDLARSIESGHWPGYDRKVHDLNLPEYRRKQAGDLAFMGV